MAAVLLDAAWLAAQGEGWALEAYQAASKLAGEGYAPAQAVLERLEQGEFPEPPQAE